jgi:hypothetical protein
MPFRQRAHFDISRLRRDTGFAPGDDLDTAAANHVSRLPSISAEVESALRGGGCGRVMRSADYCPWR